MEQQQQQIKLKKERKKANKTKLWTRAMTKIKLTLKKFIIKKKLKETSHLICANKYEKKTYN